jgi:hypothetical protein
LVLRIFPEFAHQLGTAAAWTQLQLACALLAEKNTHALAPSSTWCITHGQAGLTTCKKSCTVRELQPAGRDFFPILGLNFPTFRSFLLEFSTFRFFGWELIKYFAPLIMYFF